MVERKVKGRRVTAAKVKKAVQKKKPETSKTTLLEWFKTLPYYDSVVNRRDVVVLAFETPDGVLTTVTMEPHQKQKNMELIYQTYVYPEPYNPKGKRMVAAGGAHVFVDLEPLDVATIQRYARKASKDVSDAYEKRMKQKAAYEKKQAKKPAAASRSGNLNR